MFYAHQNYPSIRLPRNFNIYLLDHIKNDFFYSLSVCSDIIETRPIIMSLIKIIPVHLIDSDSKYRLKIWIYSLRDQTLIKKLIYEETSCMAIIEDEWMPQRLGFGIVGCLRSNECK